MYDCGCVCHTGWATPEHPYGPCCQQPGGVYPRAVLLERYDVADLPPDPLNASTIDEPPTKEEPPWQ